MVEYARREGWEVVLVNELRAQVEGVVWLGQGEEAVVLVHSARAGVLLRGEVLKAWSDEGMKKRVGERSVSVKVKGIVFTSTYQPVWTGSNEQEVEAAKEELEGHVEWAGRDELLVVGGDWNAHVGGGERRRGTCGKFGLRRSNEQCRRLFEWCEQNG